MTILEQKKYDEILADVKSKDEAMRWWLRWKCQSDLYFLGSEIFNLKDAKDKATRRRRLDPHMHRIMAKELCMAGDKLLLYPRLHMKSTWVKYRIIQLILIDPNVRIGLWSRTSTLAKKELRSIIHLLGNETLRELFPDIIPDPGVDHAKWQKCTDAELTVYRDLEGYIPQENQVEAWGVDSTVTGHHYDYHFYDDIIDKKSVKTAEQIEKTHSWWRDLQAVRDISAEECITGTRKHHADIYSTLIRENHCDIVIVHKAIQTGKPFYSFFTMKYLDNLKKRMGDYDFSLEMMNDPLPMSERLFRPPYPVYHELPKEEYKWYISVDFAYSEKKWSNWTGICVGAVPAKHPDKVFFYEAFRIKKPTNEVAQIIVDKIVQYRPRRIGIESQMQSAIQYMIDLKLKAWETKNNRTIRPDFFPIPQKHGQMSKADKIDATLGAFVRESRAVFKPTMHELFHQMDYFNRYSDKNDDDILDAASMMIQTVENFAAAHWVWFGQAMPDPNFTIERLRRKKTETEWDKRFAS